MLLRYCTLIYQGSQIVTQWRQKYMKEKYRHWLNFCLFSKEKEKQRPNIAVFSEGHCCEISCVTRTQAVSAILYSISEFWTLNMEEMCSSETSANCTRFCWASSMTFRWWFTPQGRVLVRQPSDSVPRGPSGYSELPRNPHDWKHFPESQIIIPVFHRPLSMPWSYNARSSRAVLFLHYLHMLYPTHFFIIYFTTFRHDKRYKYE
jgi:hypothetical protein